MPETSLNKPLLDTMNTTIEAPEMTPASHDLKDSLECLPEFFTALKAQAERNKTAQAEARAQLDSILSLTKALRDARENDNETAMDKAREAILEDALGVLVRSDWVAPGAENFPVAEFSILLATVGPACRLIGTLDRGEPYSVSMEWQDWGTPWTPVRLTREEQEACLEYAGQFCWEC